MPRRVQATLHFLGDGRLAGAREPGQPDGDGALPQESLAIVHRHVALLAGDVLRFRHRSSDRCAEFVLWHPVNNHAGPDGVVGVRVDDNEAPCDLILRVGIEKEAAGCPKYHASDLVQGKGCRRRTTQRVDVDAVLDLLDRRPRRPRRVLDEVGALRAHALLGHPDHHGLEVRLDHPRKVLRMDQHIATRDVDLVLERHRDGHRRKGVVVLASEAKDRPDPARLHGRQDPDVVAHLHDPRGDLTRETSEVEVRAHHVLDRKPEIDEIPITPDVNVLQVFEDVAAPGQHADFGPCRTRARL